MNIIFAVHTCSSVCVVFYVLVCAELTDASAFPKASPVCELLAPELCARFAATHTHPAHSKQTHKHTKRGKEGGSLVNKDIVNFTF